jgi:hypothetical protein
MLRRRWLQFSLRFLFAAMLLAAAVAWWFRPGVVKPEFSLERFSCMIDETRGKKQFNAHIRVTNTGRDSIWLRNNYDCHYKSEMEDPPRTDQRDWETLDSWSIHAPGQSPLRLRPREFNVFQIPVDERAPSFKIGVDIADHRNQREQTYWSQAFTIPDDLFSSPTP